MADVRTFRAGSMQEALNRVRRELGAEAVILHTRQIAHRSILPWRRRKQEVEVTAGLGINVSPEGSETGQSAAAAQHVPPTEDAEDSLALASEEGIELTVEDPSHAGTETERTEMPRRQPAAKEADGSEVHRPPLASNQSGLSQRENAGEDRSSEMAEKLDSIHQLLQEMGRSSSLVGTEEIPTELFHLYTELIDAEVEEALARDLVFRLKQHATAEQLNDAAAARSLLTAMVESSIHCAHPISVCPGQRKVVALVGPTGVGKTTTIAKLAANFRLRDGVKMGLVTVDTYRIAAVEQLRTYAEIIDLPMKVVTTPLEMRRALDELTGLDLVLIDTAGRSPRDDLKIQELKSLLAEAGVDEVHLVLSLTASLRSLEATAEKFAPAGTTAMVLSKLDEVAGMGTLFSASQRLSLPVSYLTTGQDVPEDIEPATAERIARLVLGQDTVFQ